MVLDAKRRPSNHPGAEAGSQSGCCSHETGGFDFACRSRTRPCLGSQKWVNDSATQQFPTNTRIRFYLPFFNFPIRLSVRVSRKGGLGIWCDHVVDMDSLVWLGIKNAKDVSRSFRDAQWSREARQAAKVIMTHLGRFQFANPCEYKLRREREPFGGLRMSCIRRVQNFGWWGSLKVINHSPDELRSTTPPLAGGTTGGLMLQMHEGRDRPGNRQV